MEEREGQRRADPASRRTPASHAAGSILPPSPLDRRWFVHLADKTYGPYNGQEIKKLAAEGLITATALVYPEGGSAWIEAKNEPTLGALFRSQAPAPQPSSGIAAARTVAQTAPSTDNAATPANVKRKRKRFGFDPRTLFQSADQEAVRNDLRDYFGPHAEKYLAVYDKMQARNKPYVVTWNWPVFATFYPWQFYRKMPGMGAANFFGLIVVAILFRVAGILVYAVLLALTTKSQYVLAAMKSLEQADRRSLIGRERQDYLRRRGGVSVVGAVLSGASLAVLVAATIYAIWLMLLKAH
jgi:uncharacterized membrane protein